MAIVGLDIGRRRIGIAIVSRPDFGAQPLSILKRHSLAKDLENLRVLVREWQVDLIVAGLPLNMDGSEGPAARDAREFAACIAAGTGVPVDLHDERLTSFEARERLRQTAGRERGEVPRRRPAPLDNVAAAVILEGWLNSHPERSRKLLIGGGIE